MSVGSTISFTVQQNMSASARLRILIPAAKSSLHLRRLGSDFIPRDLGSSGRFECLFAQAESLRIWPYLGF
jgi:hypothetical protein